MVLPADYLAEHCEYGWASTIDGAQGVTADLGLVLVRPGMDREHLYVAMTRGRHANHAYITPDPSSDNDGHHGPAAGVRTATQPGTDQDPAARLREQTMQVVRNAVMTSGAQDAAHTALATARATADTAARRDVEQQAAQAEAHHRDTQQLPAEHQQTVQQLTDRHTQHAQLQTRQDTLTSALELARQELQALPRWARRRRRDSVHDAINNTQHQLGQVQHELANVVADIDWLTRQVERHATQRASNAASTAASTAARAAARRAWADVWDGTGLTNPRAGRNAWPPTSRSPETPSRTRPGSAPTHDPLPPPQPSRGRSR